MSLVKGRFTIKSKDAGGNVFENVSRFECEDKEGNYKIFVDINTDLFPLDTKDTIELELTTSLNFDNSPMDFKDGYTPDFGVNSKMDNYDYVMHGIVFKFVEDKSNDKVSVIASFGGLLFMVYASQSLVSGINMDDQVFLLISKEK
ncbi:DNA-directed RNA polymerase I, II, and III subunit RPABC3, putative [Entamoeba invadens IP1]|uniref:DNA-directed RNA polymerases I, II, and III subunit RPABC3 n=1 Tax=Entamoeba invadens IP1 TaxID=370355 RepID=A0A0A1U081_ENTIV|nr:DNA-directed RNA polymerase I, II, and III subunit RPABC3, putative [Entamoeba invadens IP1]ELP87292.1 DNA-directed RNA polymerase I, II, and III subunit RPABC3, putative [Entamoeba invadens IP1]|eukprot:XP_004254063.1 DNA-directed RNA polymerase I, II, and III subunit RPABC3, putative [Entamoeba invadens IP1]